MLALEWDRMERGCGVVVWQARSLNPAHDPFDENWKGAGNSKQAPNARNINGCISKAIASQHYTDILPTVRPLCAVAM